MAPSANQRSKAAPSSSLACRHRRASAPACARQSVTAARTSASTRWRSATTSRRPRASARSTSRYMIDSRRDLSSQSGSIGGRAAVGVAPDADHRMEQAVDDQAARGERVGDRIDQERHVVIDDSDPHPAMAERPAERFEPDQGDCPAARRAAQAAMNSAASIRSASAKSAISPGRAPSTRAKARASTIWTSAGSRAAASPPPFPAETALDPATYRNS